MRRLLVSSLLIAGMALGGVTGVHAAGDYENKQDSMQKNDMTQPETRTENFSGEGQEYTVQEGDTLASIAEEHLGSADQWQLIARANNIENPNQLQVGQTLTIPASGETSDASPSAFSNEPAQPGNEAQPEPAAQTPEQTAMNEASDVTRPGSDSYNTQHENETITNKSDSSFESDASSDATAKDESIKQEQEIKGEITEIGSGNESVVLKDEAGMTHTLKLDNQEVLEGIAVGDFVKAELEGGTIISLEKVDRSA